MFGAWRFGGPDVPRDQDFAHWRSRTGRRALPVRRQAGADADTPIHDVNASTVLETIEERLTISRLHPRRLARSCWVSCSVTQ
jgi:hypothetical protein